MTDLILFSFSCIAGFIGALMGLGGGIIIVPMLTLYFGIDIRYAIPVSLCATIATSLSASAENLKSSFINLRIATLLEMSTVWGAITGFAIFQFIKPAYLFYLFGFFLIFSAVLMFRKKQDALTETHDPLAQKLSLNSTYKDHNQNSVPYQVTGIFRGGFIMYIAGALSALLGVGGGILKNLAMDVFMRMPIKVSSATSNFMISVTGAASAGAYFFNGNLMPGLVAPIIFGIAVGSFVGSKALYWISPILLRRIFIIFIFLVSFQMFWKGYHS